MSSHKFQVKKLKLSLAKALSKHTEDLSLSSFTPLLQQNVFLLKKETKNYQSSKLVTALNCPYIYANCSSFDSKVFLFFFFYLPLPSIPTSSSSYFLIFRSKSLTRFQSVSFGTFFFHSVEFLLYITPALNVSRNFSSS